MNPETPTPKETIILVHGFTGSPYDYRTLAESLRDSGYRVVIPVVPGQTKATLVYRRTKNLRAVQLLLGHTKLESTVRYLGIEVDDALEMSEQTDS